jgi:hypothetical protein
MKRMLYVLLVPMVAGIAFTFAGCNGGSDDNGSNPEVSTFQATIGGSGGESGKLSATINSRITSIAFLPASAASANPVTANGTLLFVGGRTVALTGTYDPASGALNLSGGGYTFAATIAAGALNGTYTNSGGGSGYMAGLDSSSGAADVYCGTYTGTRTTPPYDVRGVFNLVIASNGRLTGLGVDDTGKGSTVDGTLSGNSISAMTSSGTTISGTRSGNTVSGTFSEPQSSGTWSGTRI